MTIVGRGPLGQKNPPVRSEALRRSAHMQPCSLRLPCCNRRLDTTVLAHLRVFNVAGMGQKPPDWCGVYACAACHDAIDRRDATTAGLWGFEDLLRGLIDTQGRMYAAGLLMVAGENLP